MMLNLRHATILATLLTACGGGGSASNAPATTASGQFIDAPVAGLGYSASSGTSGTTDASGQFSYLAGDTVRFFLGGIEIGSATGAAVVTPRDLNGLTAEGATNLARFLLTLDQDQNADNGIQLSDTVQSAASGQSLGIDDFNSSSFENTNAASFATSANGDSRDLVTAAQANSHMNQTESDLEDGQYDATPATDSDGDGVRDEEDNCDATSNPDQADIDNDQIGDACDSFNDRDGDQIADNQDNCPDTANADQTDVDNDQIGDACDSFVDRDGDQVADSQDNCPDIANADQADTDGDQIGDACDDSNGNASSWIINNSVRSAHIFESATTNTGVLVNVQSVTDVTQNGADYSHVQATGIPDYAVTLTQGDIDALNSRPRPRNDFVGNATTAQAGQTVAFGEDIGYDSATENCTTTGGDGYWPPGPVCPTNQNKQGYFPKQAQPTITECETSLGVQGYWVNGTSIYNWGDGTSAEDGVWYTLAPVAEQYDVDICGGHAAQGDYHHHFYSSCLANLVGDQGDGHSPIYGFAADGYPIYGPWEADGVLAISSWVTREYTANSPTGCGSDGVRSCILVDPFDVSQGTEPATTGPSTSDTYRTLSGNTLEATTGFFYEDYYWDAGLTAQGIPYLDQYNGHSVEGYGYHYHVTVVQTDNGLSPSFPYTVGTRFAGQLADNAVTDCAVTPGGGGGSMGPPPAQ